MTGTPVGVCLSYSKGGEPDIKTTSIWNVVFANMRNVPSEARFLWFSVK